MKKLITLLLVLFLYGQANAYTVLIKWMDNSGNESGFVLERAEKPTGTPLPNEFVPIAGLTADTTQYIDDLPNVRARYCWRVKATNPAGDSSYSNFACYTVPLPSPSKLTVGKAP